MTKKDYIAFAKLINEATDRASSLETKLAISMIAGEIADIFQADNPRFDRVKFAKACFPNV